MIVTLRAKLRQHLRDFKVSLLDYCVTSNHVHLLIDAQDRLEVSGFMRMVAGEFARAYNRRKKRTNAFWGDNFHATLVEGGDYLWRCLCYVELNMVRCGVVWHPQEWEWVGFHEIMGRRRRNRLLDLDELFWRLGTDSLEEVRTNLTAALDQTIARDEVQRVSCWTESVAVGSVSFLEKIQPLILSRRETEIVSTTDNVWVLKEAPVAYGHETSPESASNGII